MATSSSAVPTSLIGRERVGSFARLLGPLAALAAVVVFFGAAEFVRLVTDYRGQTATTSFAQFYADRGTFFTAQNGRNVLVQAAPVAVAALGMTVIIIA